MLKIGITGGIGSGKTTVCKIFEVLGIPVFYADTHAKLVMTKDPLLVAGVSSAFGPESYDSSGNLNNKHIAGIVFSDSAALAQLNALVHPAVFRAFDIWLSGIPSTVPYILKEAALLFESGSYKACDFNVLVTSPKELRLNRVIKRDATTIEAVEARMAKQMSDEEKAGMADHFVINDEKHALISQVMALHNTFLSDNL